MENYTEIMVELLLFTIVAILFMMLLSIVLKIVLKKFKPKSDKLNLYGLLLNMDNKALISVSCIAINYIFLIWLLITFKELNLVYILFTVILTIIGDLVILNFPRIFLNLLITSVNCVCIYIVYLLKDYITNEYMSYPVLIALILVIIFIFLFYTYNLFRSLNVIANKNKYVEKKDYKI